MAGLIRTRLTATMMVPLALPTAYNWTGGYVGADAGYARSSSSTIIAPDNNVANILAKGPRVPAQHATGQNGWLADARTGWNVQILPRLVVGIEANVAGGILSGDQSLFGYVINYITSRTVAAASAPVHAGLVIRVGFLPPFATTMLYGTFGVAGASVTSSAKVEFRSPITVPENVPWLRLLDAQNRLCPQFGCPSGSAQAVKVGWTFGGGVESVIAPRQTVRAEFRHIDLGELRYALSDDSNPSEPTRFTATTRVRWDQMTGGTFHRF